MFISSGELSDSQLLTPMSLSTFYSLLQAEEPWMPIFQHCHNEHKYVVGQLNSRTRHRVLAMAALEKSLSMVWWRSHIAFHSCIVVDLWQSLSEWHLWMSACVLVCSHENVGAWITAVKFLATKQISVLEHPAYSSDLAHSDFFLFVKIKYWNEGILMTSGIIQQQFWGPFHKTSSKIVLKGGLGSGISG